MCNVLFKFLINYTSQRKGVAMATVLLLEYYEEVHLHFAVIHMMICLQQGKSVMLFLIVCYSEEERNFQCLFNQNDLSGKILKQIQFSLK